MAYDWALSPKTLIFTNPSLKLTLALPLQLLFKIRPLFNPSRKQAAHNYCIFDTIFVLRYFFCFLFHFSYFFFYFFPLFFNILFLMFELSTGVFHLVLRFHQYWNINLEFFISPLNMYLCTLFCPRLVLFLLHEVKDTVDFWFFFGN